jgi:hypothetical protein
MTKGIIEFGTLIEEDDDVETATEKQTTPGLELGS